MTVYLGDFPEDATVHFQWSTNDSDGASITRSTNGTVSVYKDNGLTQSTAGVTDTEDFDSLTGIHACTIDLSADAFYATGSNYTVVLSAATIDGQTVNAVLAHFSIENRYNDVNVASWLGTAVTLGNGAPDVNIASTDDIDLSATQKASVNAEVDTAITDAALATAAALTTVDTVVDGIKTQTDKITFTVANQVDANIESVNSVTVTGTGASGDEWRPA